MKLFVLIILASFILVSCDEKPKNPAAEYGDALMGSYKKAQDAADTANLDALKKAVQAYRATNEKYPQDLDEIKNLLNGEIDLSKFSYDPQTGEVVLKKN
jgi:hypothetical protein